VVRFRHLAPFWVVPVHWVAVLVPDDVEDGDFGAEESPSQQFVPTLLWCILQ